MWTGKRFWSFVWFCSLCKPIVAISQNFVNRGGIHTDENYALKLEIEVNSLLTEYLESPLGVDEAIPRVSWQIQTKAKKHHAAFAGNTGKHAIPRGIYQTSYQLHVSFTSTSPEFIDCGWVASNETSLVPLDCEGLTPIATSDMNVSWKVSVKLNDDSVVESDVAFFRTGVFGPWEADWISGWGWDVNEEKQRTLFRKEFFVAKPNEVSQKSNHATLFVAGIGYHHVYLNGEKVGDHELDPGWTNYTKRVWYSTYDVTHLLESDEENLETNDDSNDDLTNNVIAVMLGNGWWSCGPSPGTGLDYCTHDPPQLILQLHVNGEPVLISDETWLTSADSPILYNSLYNGEIYDARVAHRMKGWKTLHFDDSDWETATLATNDATRAILASQLFEPIRHISKRSPVSISVRGNGDNNLTQVIDFGQNQAAVVRLKHFQCPSGTTVVMRHAELLVHPPYGDFDNTTIYVDNLRAAKATDIYICSGDPNGESYTPTFTQHGFRYVEITGLDYTLDPLDIEAVELHSDIKQTSSIKFADPLLNQIQHMVLWGLKSNFMSVQTDCDQRDERKGWMGDAALTAEAAVLSYGMGAFYTHWLVSIVYCVFDSLEEFCLTKHPIQLFDALSRKWRRIRVPMTEACRT